MHIMYFTERPYREVPEEEVIKNRSFFGVPNRFFDRKSARGCTTNTSTKQSMPRRWASMA